MTNWSDLPTEIQQQILAFYFANEPIAFRSSNEDHPDPSPPTNLPLLSVLTVSREFVQYEDVMTTMLQNAVIELRNPQEIHRLAHHLPSRFLTRVHYVRLTSLVDEHSDTRVTLGDIKTCLPNLRQLFVKAKFDPYNSPIMSVQSGSQLSALEWLNYDEAGRPRDNTWFTPDIVNDVELVRATFSLEKECADGFIDESQIRSAFFNIFHLDAHSMKVVHSKLDCQGVLALGSFVADAGNQNVEVVCSFHFAIAFVNVERCMPSRFHSQQATFSTKDLCIRIPIYGMRLVIPQQTPDGFLGKFATKA